MKTKKKFVLSGLVFLALMVFSYNCTRKIEQPDLSQLKLDLPQQTYEYNKLLTPSGTKYLLYEDSTPIDNNKATIGRVLFYDKALSINNTVSCATCHSQANAFADHVAFSEGFFEKQTERNSINIVNLFDNRKAGYFWDGRNRKIEDMVFAPIANHIEMGFSQTQYLAEKLSNIPYYKDLFKKYYGDESISEKRIKESLGHFLYSIVSYNSKFDQDKIMHKNFSSDEKVGLAVFEDKCITCHRLNDQSFYSREDTATYGNIGLDVRDKDKGRNGLFKIPSLRNVSRTAPYMHDGRFKTLEEVVLHYGRNMKANPNLSSKLGDNSGPYTYYLDDFEIDYLMIFLKTLDDDVVINDPKLSNPF